MEIEVSEDDSGLRLDIFLAKQVPGLSRRSGQDLIDRKKVLRNGSPTRKGTKVERGDLISVLETPPPADAGAQPNSEIALRVRYEDPHILIVEKPSGMPSHPLRATETETLANGLVAAYPETEGVGFSPLQPGLVNRLDVETSGLVLAARSQEAWEAMRSALSEGRVRKTYLCACDGWIGSPRLLDWYLVNDPRDRRRVHCCLSEVEAQRLGGRPAATRVIRSFHGADASLVKVEVSSAFRHQIRTHMATAGHPLWGDLLYGGRAIDGLEGQFLHAESVSFEHPFSGESVEVVSELPDSLRSALPEDLNEER